MQPISTNMLEVAVFSKQVFDRQGLIVATLDEQPVGFVHAAFGPNESQTAIDTDIGTTQVLMIRPEDRSPELTKDLLAQSEAYLRSRGAKVFYAGGIRPMNAFYLGLYGGSELPGVLEADPLQTVLRSSGYREIDRVIVLQRELAGFRPEISRQARQIRRDFTFSESFCPAPENWWEAGTQGDIEHLRFSLMCRRDQTVVASVQFWDIEPLASSWEKRASGMYDLYVAPDFRRQGLSTFLLNESIKKLMFRGIGLLEAHTMHHNQPAICLYGKLGFTAVDCGYVFRKNGGEDILDIHK